MLTLDYRIIRIPDRWNWKKYTMLSKTANEVREQTSVAQGITSRIIWNIFIHFLALSFNSVSNFFRTQAAQYECSYRRTAHHATDLFHWAIISFIDYKKAFDSAKHWIWTVEDLKRRGFVYDGRYFKTAMSTAAGCR